MNITIEQLQEILPSNREISQWVQVLNRTLPQYGINTPERIAAFVAQCAHESSEFKVIEENLNYSESSIRRVFGKYFSGDRNPKDYAYKPDKLANVVYANRMGNGGTETGDGWLFHGRGLIQLTGRNNYAYFAAHCQLSIPKVIEYLETKEGSVHSACWYWWRNDLNRFADTKDFRGLTRAINGGYNGYEERTNYYMKSLTVFGGGLTWQVGSKGDAVKRIQLFVGAAADGDFGPMTKKAVMEWQKNHGFEETGVVTQEQYKEMETKR